MRTPSIVRNDRDDAVLRYRHGLSPEDAIRQPYYHALLEALSHSATALDLLCEVPLEQRNAMLPLAILHYRALRGESVLAPLYASINGANRPTPEQFAATVVALVEAQPELVREQLHRTVQTNEVGRSAVLQAVLRELRRRGLTDVNLLDVGTSAGLNLYLDHYNVATEAGGDPLTLVCESLTSDDRPGPLPTIHKRVGIDRNPLDLRRADDAMWLRACLWPENPDRLRRLEQLESLAPAWEPLTLLRGDALGLLSDALGAMDNAYPTIVMHTWVAAYFSEELQELFATELRRRVRKENLYWLYLEWPRGVRGLLPPEPTAKSPRSGASQIVVAQPGGVATHWGWCHAHGRWLSLSVPSDSPKP